MFDWNDEELSNIIWDEGGESDDHIVPHPEASEDLYNEKKRKKDASEIKLTEQKIHHAKIDFRGRKMGNSCNVDDEVLSVSGFGMDLWPELPTPKAAKTDESTVESQVLNSESGSNRSEHMHVSAEISQQEKEAETCQNNRGVERGDFVDYGWDNIGSFDDLDRIFSNDEPIFGNVSLDNAHELWTSRDGSNSTASMSLNSPRSSGSLRSEHEHLDVQAEYNQQSQAFAIDAGKDSNPALCNLQNVHTLADHLGYVADTVKQIVKMPQIKPAGGNSILTAEDVLAPNEALVKAKNNLESQKKSKRRLQGKMSQDFYSEVLPSTDLSGQYVNQLAPSGMQATASPVFQQQRQFQVADSLQYHNISSPYVNPSGYGNLTHTYPVMPVCSSIQSGQLRHRSMAFGHEGHPSKVNLVKLPVDTYVKPLAMTPQEKIEKLRRRQQMQAMLAIQKQHQQLSHQVSLTNEYFTHESKQENQTYFSDGTDFDARDMSTIPALDPNSQIEQDDSSAISAAAVDEYMVEDTVLYRLQEIISKLDIKIRLCIRDSLFRLAQSAIERHCGNDTSSTNKHNKDEVKITAKDELSGYSRYAGVSVNETETNHIDRIVARLLFHRPMNLSGDNPAETHDSPISVKASGFMNPPLGCSQEDLSCNYKHPFSKQGLKNESCTLTESHHGDQFRNSPCVENSENASTSGPANVGMNEVEAYQ